MSYQIKTNGDRVILHVLVGATQSLVGLRIRHCEIISMTVREFCSLVLHIRGIQEHNHFYISLFEHQVSTNDEDEIIVLEAVEPDSHPLMFEDDVLAALRLFKAEDIYSCYFDSYRFVDGKIVGGGRAKTILYEHSIDHLPIRYSLTSDEKEQFPAWFDAYFPNFSPSKQNKSYKSMLKAYHTSYLVGVVELEFIMLFSILEMIFGSGHSEITYQISRGTALLLSEKSAEMESVYKRMKKLYGVRSKYVHGGEKVDPDFLYELRDIVRKILIKLIDLNYHIEDASFDDLRNKILLSGYNAFSTEQPEGETNV